LFLQHAVGDIALIPAVAKAVELEDTCLAQAAYVVEVECDEEALER
jgi:hypothetical protein